MIAAWHWFRKWGAWLVTGLAGLALGITAILLGRERRKRLTAEARAQVAELTKQVEASRARREAILERVDEHDEAIAVIDREIDDSERAILSHYEDVGGLTRDEIRERLRRVLHE